MKCWLPVIVGLVFGAIALPLSAEDLVLVAEGRPTAVIVLPASAAPRERQAAEEIRRWVERCTGVRLPIEAHGRRVPGTAIYIGACEPTLPSDGPAGDLNPESFAIRLREGDLYLVGRTATPTYFAAISFVEESLGIRWLAPGDAWTFVPEPTPGELVVRVASRVVVPDTSPRVWSGHHWTPDWTAWNLRNKTAPGEVIPRRNFQNNLHHVFLRSRFEQSHPEYFPLVNGRRWFPPSDGYRYWLPCTSNPGVIAVTADAARAFFDAHPTVNSFSLGQDDIVQFCGCDDCVALDTSPHDHARKFYSDRYYQFINVVAREVKKTHPDRYLGALIYNNARPVPRTVTAMEENVFGFLTENSFAWWQPGLKEKDQALTRAWAGRLKHLSRYDYYGLGTVTPRFAPGFMAEQFRLDKSLGLEGMYTEVYTFLPHTAPMIWALAKLQWDASQDVRDLLDTFYVKAYGSSAATMKQYFELLERAWAEPRPGRPRHWDHRDLLIQSQAMTVEDLRRGEALLEQALAETSDLQVRHRIEIHLGGLRYAGYVIRTFDIVHRIRQVEVTDEASAARVLDLAAGLVALPRERDAFWREAEARQDLLGENLRGLLEHGRDPYLQIHQISQIEMLAVAPVARALARVAIDRPEALAARLTTLASADTPLRELVERKVWEPGRHSENLVRNGGFEQASRTDESQAPIGQDAWEQHGLPEHWSFWSRFHKTLCRQVVPGAGLADSSAAYLRLVEDLAHVPPGRNAGTFIQPVNIEAGRWYWVTAQVRIASESLGSEASLAVRFHDTRGRWHPDRSHERKVLADASSPDWQTLGLLVQAPPQSGALVVMVGGSLNGGLADEVFFDDVQVRRLEEPAGAGL